MSVGTVEASELVPLPAPAHAPGELIIGKYRLERPLGAGGQAAVWQARNLALDARVALKLLHEGAPDEAQAARLLREARAVASLGHPAVVRVFDLACMPSGEWFIVMELLEGRSLADQLLDRGRLSARDTIQQLLPIVDALGAAHALGIVHRDVKPDNVFLARAGASIQPKLLDFGVAKLKRGQEHGWHTVAGTVLGTPAYLSPEQAEGSQDIDHRSDVWSLCATLYECVTGSLPFGGDTDEELFSQIAERDPDSIVEHAAGDAALWALVRRGLAKERDKRWPSMQAFGEALASWLVDHGVDVDACGVSLRGKWLPAEVVSGQDHSTLPPTDTAPVFARQPPDAAPARTRWVLAMATMATVLVSTLAFSMWREEDPAPLRPLNPVVARTGGTVTTPPPRVSPVTALGDARSGDSLEKPGASLTPPPATDTATATAPGAAGAGSRRKATADRLRPARDVAEPKSLDLISPYR